MIQMRTRIVNIKSGVLVFSTDKSKIETAKKRSSKCFYVEKLLGNKVIRREYGT